MECLRDVNEWGAWRDGPGVVELLQRQDARHAAVGSVRGCGLALPNTSTTANQGPAIGA